MKEKTIYALGFFDGVHIGHGALLNECRKLADQFGCKAAAVTFSSHPDTLVLGKTPELINTIEDRVRLLKQFGMDEVIILPFDRKIQTMDWQEFLASLRKDYGAVGLVCGHDFRFGHKGEGDAEKLRRYCEAKGLPCIIVPEQTLDGIRISSTHIRQLIEQGDMETASKFLGHPHALSGQVVAGRQVGRTIGIPTANILIPEGIVVPRLGVYACRCRVGEDTYPAVTNVGTRPTVEGRGITVEPWILDYSGDLYGRQITLEFFHFLRPERKFPSLEALKEEIQRDAEGTRLYLKRMFTV